MTVTVGSPFQVNWDNSSRAILGADGQPVSLSWILGDTFRANFPPSAFDDTVAYDQHRGFVRDGKKVGERWELTTEFGFCMAKPIRVLDRLQPFLDIANDVDALTWFIHGGVLNDKANDDVAVARMEVFIGNAARKLNLLARNFRWDKGPWSTMELMRVHRDRVRNPVTSTTADGSMLWGEFPHPGGVIVSVGPWLLMGAVSAFTGPQDHVQATKALVRVGEYLEDNHIEEITDVDWSTQS